MTHDPMYPSRRHINRIIHSLLPGNPFNLGDRRTAILAARDEAERRLELAMDQVSWFGAEAMLTALEVALDAEPGA